MRRQWGVSKNTCTRSKEVICDNLGMLFLFLFNHLFYQSSKYWNFYLFIMWITGLMKTQVRLWNTPRCKNVVWTLKQRRMVAIFKWLSGNAICFFFYYYYYSSSRWFNVVATYISELFRLLACTVAEELNLSFIHSWIYLSIFTSSRWFDVFTFYDSLPCLFIYLSIHFSLPRCNLQIGRF